MTSNGQLTVVAERGWRMGLSTLLGAENGNWWRTRRWWTQALIWTAILNGILGLTIWSGEGGDSDEALGLYFIFAHVFVTLGVVVISQGVIVGEKQSGTAAWMLSKPVSRPAFVLSKTIATWLAVFLILIVIQGGLAYLQISLNSGTALPVGLFIAGLGMAALSMTFFLTLTLMLGTFFNSRGPVVGIPIMVFFIPAIAGELILRYAPWWFQITPSAFVEFSGQVATGAAEIPVIPMIATALWSVFFVAAGIWRFGREEF